MNKDFITKTVEGYSLTDCGLEFDKIMNSLDLAEYFCPKFEFHPVALMDGGLKYHLIAFFVKKPISRKDEG